MVIKFNFLGSAFIKVFWVKLFFTIFVGVFFVSVMFWRTELMRKFLNYVLNMFLELLQNFRSNQNSNGFNM